MAIDVSVVIATLARPRKLANCVRALARQSLPVERYEVLVGLDGPDPASVEAATRVWDGPEENLTIDVAPPAGLYAVRNRLIERARGETLVFLDDDVIPDATLLEAHAIEQAAARGQGRSALVIGPSTPTRPRNERLFDRLIRETRLGESLIGASAAAGSAGDGRQCDLCQASSPNLSAPRQLVHEAGGFGIAPDGVSGYEHAELAFRLSTRCGMSIVRSDDAGVEHDRRVNADECLREEYMLGFLAPAFARLHPECARAVFGRDVLAPAEIEYARGYVARESGHAARLRESLEKLGMMPPDLLDGDQGGVLARCFAEQHAPLMLWAWRAGLADAVEGRAANPLRTREPMAETTAATVRGLSLGEAPRTRAA